MTGRRAYEGRHPVTWLDFVTWCVIVAVVAFGVGTAIRYVVTHRVAPAATAAP